MIVKPKIARCKRCDTEFIKKTANQIFCSHRCKAPLVKSYGERVSEPQFATGECRECAKEFLKKVTSSRQFCCGETCYKAYVKRTSRESKPLRDCKVCGAEFKYSGRAQHTCSNSCKLAYYAQKGVSCITLQCTCGAEIIVRKDTKSAKLSARKNWICHECLYSDAKMIHCEKCGKRTRSLAGRTKCAHCTQAEAVKMVVKCDTCGGIVRRTGETRCGYCRERPSQIKKGTIRKPYVKKKKQLVVESYPCATCQHGKSSTHSDTGWECKASAAICKPWSQKNLYKELVIV